MEKEESNFIKYKRDKNNKKLSLLNNVSLISRRMAYAKDITGIDIKKTYNPTIFIYVSIFTLCFGIMTFDIYVLLFAAILYILAMVLMLRKSYRVAYKWNRIILNYGRKNYKTSSKLLNKLPKSERNKEEYNKMIELIKSEYNGQSV